MLIRQISTKFLSSALMPFLAIPFARSQTVRPQSDVILPGERWLDDRGQPIQAHGGGILHWEGVYYWVGEDRSQHNDPEKRYVACYASKDLVHWTFRGQILALADPEHLGSNWVLERPKLFHNPHTGQFILYFHLDDGPYKLARVGIAVSDRVDGSYSYVKSFRPFDQESRDIGQFIDDDGSAYIIFESRPTKGFYIAKLSDDYMTVDKQISFIPSPLEGGALVHYDGLYYVLGSHMTGWSPNPNVYATSPSLSGPWTEFKDITPPEANTYEAQSTMIVKIVGSRETSVIFMGDIWKPAALWDSRYLWMPVRIGSGEFHLPSPHPWLLNVETGNATIE
jgi:sucrose-6-phosphate hydrolase SacC (GH32 family)